MSLEEAAYRVLRFPAVADKSFLITIGDRSVGGLINRDQLVGPWQVPVSDVAVTLVDFHGTAGEAMAMGERSPVAVLDAPASGRLAVAEAITNILAADIDSLAQVRLSANWMAACGEPGEDAALYETVRAVGKELCPQLGIAIPVGKDSLSMKTAWREGELDKSVVAPVSLVVSAFAPVRDVRRTLTPALQLDERPTSLWLIDLSAGRNRLGGSALAQVYGELGEEPADLDEPARLTQLAAALKELRAEGMLLAYHDRSDGGLFVDTARDGLRRPLRSGHRVAGRARHRRSRSCSAEEPGVVVQVMAGYEPLLAQILERHGLGEAALYLGAPVADLRVQMRIGAVQFDESWVELKRAWSETSWRMRRLRDDPQCADEEFAALTAADDPGLSVALSFDPEEDIAAPYIARGVRPAVAILREQGVNSQTETAAVFDRAGFTAHDVHMTDLLSGRRSLCGVQGRGRLRRILVRRRAGSRGGLGQVDPVPRRGARGVRALLCAQRRLRVRHLQRLPDVRGPQEHHSGHRALAAVREEPQRTVRGAFLAGRSAGVPLGAVRGHGRFVPADRGGARRGAGGVCLAGGRRGVRQERTGGPALREPRTLGRDAATRTIRAALPLASRPCRMRTGASRSPCRTRSARSATCRTRGGRGWRGSTAAGRACSATRGASSTEALSWPR